MADVIVTSAGATSVTENSVINSIVQDELLRAAKLRPTIRDYSSLVGKGDKEVVLPKFTTSFSGPAAQNVDGATNVDFQSPVLGADTIAIDDWTNLPFRIPDRVSMQSKVNLEAELAKSAGKHYGNYMDDLIIAQLRQGSAAAPDHLLDIDGTDGTAVGTAISLSAISKARMLLNKQNVSMDERYLIISPDQEKVIIDLDNFISADRYGSRSALLDGEVGRIYGFSVIVHNGLNSNEALAYHKDACGMAVQREVKFETQRADVRLQATDYSFSLGMGAAVLQGGKLNIRLQGAP